MYSSRDSEESCKLTRVPMHIIDGKPWIARSIRNNNFRQHCHLLGRTFRQPHPITDPLRPSARRLVQIISSHTSLMADFHPSKFPTIPVLIRIAAYASRWIRQPETWEPPRFDSPQRVVSSLLDHLFVRWPVPDFFKSAWLEKGDLPFLERDWFCEISQGKSMRSLQGIPPSVSNRALHWAIQAPDDLSIRQAIRWGQVKALGGSDEFHTEVLRSRMVRDLSNDAIWSRLLEKMIAASLKPSLIGVVADALLDPVAKGNLPRAQALLDAPMRDLLRHSFGFWRSLLESSSLHGIHFHKTDVLDPHLRGELLILNSGAWEPMIKGPAFEMDQADSSAPSSMIIEELTQYQALIGEGRAMRNCVASYFKACRTGQSAIFSLKLHRKNDRERTVEPLLTIEVSPKSRRIIQVRGYRNRWVSWRSMPVIHEWARWNNLVI